jgi:hypothetical protein
MDHRKVMVKVVETKVDHLRVTAKTALPAVVTVAMVVATAADKTDRLRATTAVLPVAAVSVVVTAMQVVHHRGTTAESLAVTAVGAAVETVNPEIVAVRPIEVAAVLETSVQETTPTTARWT